MVCLGYSCIDKYINRIKPIELIALAAHAWIDPLYITVKIPATTKNNITHLVYRSKRSRGMAIKKAYKTANMRRMDTLQRKMEIVSKYKAALLKMNKMPKSFDIFNIVDFFSIFYKIAYYVQFSFLYWT